VTADELAQDDGSLDLECRVFVNDELIAICNEAIANAFKHSNARNIDVDIVYRRRDLVVRIRDNGVGIDPTVLANGRRGHFGLAGMRERAQKIRAAFTLSSKSNVGRPWFKRPTDARFE